jgi:adenosylcobinamide-GDP ribazoletransferase
MTTRRTRPFASGWTFFFRWPVLRVDADAFVPASILLGPFLQAGAFALVAALMDLVAGSRAGLPGFLAFVMLSLWTGFFHDDGFADTADSLGVSKFDDSDAVLDRIHAAMKDSRLGTFGVSALVLLWVFRGLGSFAWDLPWPVLAAIVLSSRAGAFAAAWSVGRYLPVASARRSGHLMAAVGLGVFLAFLAACAALAVGASRLFPWGGELGLWMGLSTLLAVVGLVLLARRCQGLSGDLIGASVCSCEILLIVLAASRPM